MGGIDFVNYWHAIKDAGMPAYQGLSFRDRLKADFAYRYGKKQFGITDSLGNLQDYGSAAYEAAKRKAHEQAARVATGNIGAISGANLGGSNMALQ